MIQALMLKIAALSLLLLVGQNPQLPGDFKDQATTVANQALAAAESTLSATSSLERPVDTISPDLSSKTVSSPQVTTSATIMTNAAPASNASIEIVSPIPGKGLGRQYTASPIVTGESNYIELGAIVLNDNGEPMSNADVTITVNSETPVVIHGTGDVYPRYVDGQKRVTPVYSFHYEFKTAGSYTFTFAANGMQQSVTVTAN